MPARSASLSFCVCPDKTKRWCTSDPGHTRSARLTATCSQHMQIVVTTTKQHISGEGMLTCCLAAACILTYVQRHASRISVCPTQEM